MTWAYSCALFKYSAFRIRPYGLLGRSLYCKGKQKRRLRVRRNFACPYTANEYKIIKMFHACIHAIGL